MAVSRAGALLPRVAHRLHADAVHLLPDVLLPRLPQRQRRRRGEAHAAVRRGTTRAAAAERERHRRRTRDVRARAQHHALAARVAARGAQVPAEVRGRVRRRMAGAGRVEHDEHDELSRRRRAAGERRRRRVEVGKNDQRDVTTTALSVRAQRTK